MSVRMSTQPVLSTPPTTAPGSSTPTGAPSGLDQAHALRWLIHLCGDVHQPLHVGTGYVSRDDDDQAHLCTSVADALRIKTCDQGGNMLRYTDTEKLHGYWDTVLYKPSRRPDRPR